LVFFFFFRRAVKCHISLDQVGECRGSIPADTALLTFSVSSLLCSMYSVSSKRCFFPANTDVVSAAGRVGSPDPISGDFEDEGSIPSFRSSASSLAFCASALAAVRCGSDSRYSASLSDGYVSRDRGLKERVTRYF
jgi:hypothetical protein